MASIDDLMQQGMDCCASGDFDAAVKNFRSVSKLFPNELAGHLNLGVVLWRMKDIAGATKALEKALKLSRNSAEAYINLAVIYADEGKLEAAALHLQSGISIKPSAYAYYNLGILYRRMGKRNKALLAFDDALEYEDEWLTRLNRAAELLVLGRYEEGWDEYEQRLCFTTVYDGYPISQDTRLWKGEYVDHLLIHYEQGFGDSIQSARYLDEASTRCGHLTVRPQPALTKLFTSSFAHNPKITFTDTLVDFDAYVWLDSLPGIFQAGVKPIPNKPYILTQQSDDWRTRLEHRPGVRVGLVWAGRADALADARRRSTSLSVLDRLLDTDGVSFVSLQIDSDEADPRVLDIREHLHEWTDTAAVIHELDLVISVDTAVAHLAGAMGKPVWLLNRFDTCWRWLLDRPDTPWYPSMWIFRQPVPGDWGSVVDEVKAALTRFINKARQK